MTSATATATVIDRPMLASKVTYEAIRFPIIAQPKLDGIRCLARNHQALSRSLKPIPNKHVQKFFSAWASYLDGMDGELIVGSPTASDVYRKTVSAVMSEDGQPDFTYYVFDFPKAGLPYFARRGILQVRTSNADYAIKAQGLKPLQQPLTLLAEVLCHNAEDLIAYEQLQLHLGYEGLILRNKDALYKSGRSTIREQALLKLKQFEDAEASIVEFEELMHNANAPTKDELGLTKRSSHKANKVPTGMLGALIVKSEQWPQTFNIGSGFTEWERRFIWKVRKTLIGQTVKFKYMSVGMKDVPRFPIFLSFRDTIDMGDPLPPTPTPTPTPKTKVHARAEARDEDPDS